MKHLKYLPLLVLLFVCGSRTVIVAMLRYNINHFLAIVFQLLNHGRRLGWRSRRGHGPVRRPRGRERRPSWDQALRKMELRRGQRVGHVSPGKLIRYFTLFIHISLEVMLYTIRNNVKALWFFMKTVKNFIMHFQEEEEKPKQVYFNSFSKY